MGVTAPIEGDPAARTALTRALNDELTDKGFIVSQLDKLETLREEWRELWTRDPRASVFQSPDWLLPWTRYLWNGGRNFVEVNPHSIPGQIFRFRHRVRSEHDFEYFL